MAASGALGQEANAPSRAATRGFDAPKPKLTLDRPAPDAIAGLAPGQDLTGAPAPLDLHLSAADLDSYANSTDYQQTLAHYYPRQPRGTGKQFAGLGEAGATALALKAENALADRLQDAIDDDIDAGDLPPIADLGFGAARLAASLAIATAAVRPK